MNRVSAIGPVTIGCAGNSGGVGDVHGGEAFGLGMSGEIVTLEIRLRNHAVGKQQEQLLGGLLAPCHRGAHSSVRRTESVANKNVDALEGNVALFGNDRLGVVGEIDVGLGAPASGWLLGLHRCAASAGVA